MTRLPARADVVVVGAGLAGACAALVLSRDRRVVVVEADRPGSGASGAAAGLVNPFMGRKAKRAWRAAEALGALDRVLDEGGADGLFARSGVLRPAPPETGAFRERAAEHPDELEWLTPGAVAERFPHVAAPAGALLVRRGGHVEVGALAAALVRAAEARGAITVRARLASWRDDGTGVVAVTDAGEVAARHLVLCLGDGARHLPALAALGLHRVKGQTITLDRPAALPPSHPAVAGRGYVVPSTGGVVVGATFEHDFSHPAPDPALDAGLLAQGAALVPALAGAAVRGRRAGVRLTVPAAVAPGRLPLAGPLGGGAVWVFTGLGAKGLLTAPLLALALPDALDGRAPLPAEVGAALRTGRGGAP